MRFFLNSILCFLSFYLFVLVILTIIYAGEWFVIITNFIDYIIYGNLNNPIIDNIKSSAGIKILDNGNLGVLSDAVLYDDIKYPVIEKNKSFVLKFLGAIIAGLIALITIILSFKRYNQTEKQISLTEENNLNTTFKDAVTLLGSDNISVRMGGVYTLIDIAQKNPDKYAKRVNDILCNYIVAETNKEPYNTRHIQELIDLIIIENSSTFYDYEKDLSRARFIEITFAIANNIEYLLNNLKFTDVIFKNCRIMYINFNDCTFSNCKFLETGSVKYSYFSNNKFIECNFIDTIFVEMGLNWCNFEINNKRYNIKFYSSLLNECLFHIKDNYLIHDTFQVDNSFILKCTFNFSGKNIIRLQFNYNIITNNTFNLIKTTIDIDTSFKEEFKNISNSSINFDLIKKNEKSITNNVFCVDELSSIYFSIDPLSMFWISDISIKKIKNMEKMIILNEIDLFNIQDNIITNDIKVNFDFINNENINPFKHSFKNNYSSKNFNLSFKNLSNIFEVILYYDYKYTMFNEKQFNNQSPKEPTNESN